MQLLTRSIAASALLALAAPAWAVDVLPMARARMYRKSSREMWEAVHQLTKELGVPLAKLDRKGQLLVTNWEKAVTQERNGLVAPEVVEGWMAEQFQLHVFVSPFAEPARVYVDGVARTRPVTAPYNVRRVAFGAQPVSRWFFERLEAKLGEKGLPVPFERSQRDSQTRVLGAEPPCAPPPDWVGRRQQGPKAIYKPDAPYPQDDADRRRSAVVTVEAEVSEDGAVMQVHLLQGPEDGQIAAAASYAITLWRFEPARVDDCPVGTRLTVTYTFTAR